MYSMYQLLYHIRPYRGKWARRRQTHYSRLLKDFKDANKYVGLDLTTDPLANHKTVQEITWNHLDSVATSEMVARKVKLNELRHDFFKKKLNNDEKQKLRNEIDSLQAQLDKLTDQARQDNTPKFQNWMNQQYNTLMQMYEENPRPELKEALNALVKEMKARGAEHLLNKVSKSGDTDQTGDTDRTGDTERVQSDIEEVEVDTVKVEIGQLTNLLDSDTEKSQNKEEEKGKETSSDIAGPDNEQSKTGKSDKSLSNKEQSDEKSAKVEKNE